jgi:FixJ family two-component response regulator
MRSVSSWTASAPRGGTREPLLQRRYASLTPRARDVAALAVSGLLNKQIAAKFGTGDADLYERMIARRRQARRLLEP